MIKTIVEQTEHNNNRCNTHKVMAMQKMRIRNKALPVFIAGVLLAVFSICSISSASAWDVHDVLKRYVMNEYPWENVEIRDVKVIGALHDKLPETITVEKGPIGKAVFRLNFEKDNRVMVKANIKAYEWIVMSKRSFRKGHIINKEDLYVVKKDISRLPRNPVKNIGMIAGKSLKRSIVANIPLVENMINHHQVVKRGKAVKLLIGNERFSISASGITKEKGYVGKSVRAINLSSKKEVFGVLVDERTVRVDL